jgi:hypothetical protein
MHQDTDNESFPSLHSIRNVGAKLTTHVAEGDVVAAQVRAIFEADDAGDQV